MSYLPSNGLSWQGIGYSKDWFALKGWEADLGDAPVDPVIVWVKEIGAYIENERRTGKSDATIASYLTTPAAAKQFGYLGDTLPADWVNQAFKSVTPAGQPIVTVGGMSTGAKVAISVGIVVGAALLLRRKR